MRFDGRRHGCACGQALSASPRSAQLGGGGDDVEELNADRGGVHVWDSVSYNKPELLLWRFFITVIIILDVQYNLNYNRLHISP